MFDLKTIIMPGANATVQKLLDKTDTAAYYGSGSLGHLIATPIFVALMINASVNIIEDRLPEGFVTVGRSLDFIHEAPTSLGMTLRVTAIAKAIEGDKIMFDIIASDDYGEVGRGHHERAVVHGTTLFTKAHQRFNNA
jgi:fluoroacetyl-CoA thioesterase